jgi:hypothetical protein
MGLLDFLRPGHAPEAGDALLAAQQRLPDWTGFLEAELAALETLIGADGGQTPHGQAAAAPLAVQPLTGFQLIEE